MRIRPVGNGKEPEYPSKNDWNGDLTKHILKRWKGKKVVYGALMSSGLAGAIFLLLPVQTAGAVRTQSLTESEARRIATDEAAKLGIDVYPKYKQVDVVAANGKKVKHDLDIVDSKDRFAIEFISRHDREEFDATNETIEKNLSAAVSKTKIKSRLKTIVLPSPSDEDRKEQSELVRKQVRDFLTWLKQQGII